MKILGEIVEKAVKLIPRFMDIAKNLGLDSDGINGLAGLTGLLVHDKSISYRKPIKYPGLCKSKGSIGRKIKKYNHKAQRYLIILTSVILYKNGEKHPPRCRDLRRTLKILANLKEQMGLTGDGAGA